MAKHQTVSPAPVEAAQQLPPTLAARFSVRERFSGGEGWSGVVVERGHEQPLRFLKVLDPGVELAEASLLASLDHPGIPRVLETGMADGSAYFLRELVAGVPLQAAFPLPATEVVACAVQLLEVLAYVHLRGILHLDLKPGNIVRADAPGGARYHLLDFGLGRRGRGRAIGGTPLFVAPETLLGLPASPRSDLFSLGAVLFVALRSPDQALPLSRFLARFPRDDFFTALGESAEALPEPLRRVLPRLLARRPEERYADAQEALEAFTGGSGRPSVAALAPDPIALFGDALARAAQAQPDADLTIRGGDRADRHALALHAACVLGAQGITQAADECVLRRGDAAPALWHVPKLSADDIAAHLEQALGLDAASAARAAGVLAAARHDTPAALREALLELVRAGRIVPSGVRWIWPDAVAGRVRLGAGDTSVTSGDALTALAARGAVEPAMAAFRQLLAKQPQRERELRQALATGLLQCGEPSRALPLVHDLPLLRARALLHLGQIDRAQAALRALPPTEGEHVQARMLEAAIADARGEYAPARAILQAIVEPGGVEARIALGLVQQHLGDLDAAAVTLQDALAQIDGAQPFVRAAALTNLAEVKRREGDLAAGRRYHTEALRLLQEVGHVRYTAVASSNLGVIAKDLGQLDDAIEHHRRAKSLFEHVGDERGAALAEANLGVASLEAGDCDMAARRLRGAIERLARLGVGDAIPLLRAFLARALAQAGDATAAISELASIGAEPQGRVAAEVERARSCLRPQGVPMRAPTTETVTDDLRSSEGWIRREVFRTFLAVNRRLASEARLEKAMEYLLEAAVTLAGARTGLLLVVRKDGVRLELRAGDTPPSGYAFSRSLVHRAIQTRRPFTGEEAQADRGLMEMPSVRGLSIKSVLCVPFVSASGTEGALYVEHPGRTGAFGAAEKEHLEVLADQAAIAVDRMVREEQLAAELDRSRRTLEVVNRTQKRGRAAGLIGESPSMRALKEQIRKLAAADLAVLILGETGTGKELVARSIHAQSQVAQGPFVSVNCAAIPADLMESELFGHVKGAFTGADDDRTGLMELATGGTLFLDEVGDMPLAMQAKLLRALQEGTIRRVGSGENRTVNVRVVAATHRDLRAAVTAGQFRQDLFYRIAGAELLVPPLRQRGQDVLAIADDILKRLGEQHRRVLRLNPRGKEKLARYQWPGNVRELEHVLARVAILSESEELDDLQLPDPMPTAPNGSAASASPAGGWPVLSMQEVEERAIRAALGHTKGDKTAAAKVLGISRTALYDKLKRMGGA